MAPTPGTPASGKKPNQKSNGKNLHSGTKSQPKHFMSSSKKREEEMCELVNSMFVRLTSCSEQRRQQQQDGKKQVIINDMDMKRLNNCKDDDCMLIFMISQNDIQIVDICHALPSTKQQRPQQRSSPSKNQSKATATPGSGMKEGEISLLPTSLHKWFYNKMNNQSNPTSSYQIIISPMKACTSATSILRRICQPAKEVIFKIVDNRQMTIDSLSSGQYKMLCTLTYAHLLRGSYSQQFLPYFDQCTAKADTEYELIVSFQGLMQSLRLVSSSYETCNVDNNIDKKIRTMKPEIQNDQHVHQHQQLDEKIYKVSTQLQNTLVISVDKNSQTNTTPITSTQWLDQYLYALDSSPTPPRALLLHATNDTTISFCPSDECMEQLDSVSSSHRNHSFTPHTVTNHNELLQNDVVGLDNVLQELHSTLTPSLIHPELCQQSTSKAFINNFMRAPRGVLLYGPSGGKCKRKVELIPLFAVQ